MWKPEITPNDHFCRKIASSVADIQVIDLETVSRSESPISRTYLDSHESMVVVGRNVKIISDTCRAEEVSPFTPDYESILQIPVVDTAIRFDYQHTRESYMVMVRDSLSAIAMDHNLIPIFSIRQVGINVRTAPKLQV